MGKKAKKSGKKVFRWVLLVLFTVFMICFTAGAIYILTRDAWHSFDASKITNLDQTLHIYDSNGQKVATMYGEQNRQIVPLSKIPKHVQMAFLAAEDSRFYSHNGLDIRRIFGALLKDIRTGKVKEGASTISQQLIKLTHLTSAKTLERKIDEAILALQLEREFTKDEILEMYLNCVYFGHGAYGVEAASQVYFGKSVSDISVAQGAMLAGILKSPSNYAPHLNMENSIKRRNLILGLMANYGFITKEEAEAAKAEEVVLAEVQDSYPYGFFTDTVLNEARDVLGMSVDEILTGGYKIYTTLDTELQAYVEELYKDGSLFPADAADGTKCESAFIILKTQTGEISALIGGREHSVRRGFNRATQMYRQPGSAIKPPLVFAPALEQYGYTAATILYDAPTDFNGYKPSNFGGQYNGYVTLREAVAKSLNIPAVDILYRIGVKNAAAFAQKAGLEFEPEDSNLSIALGGLTKGVSPAKLSASYAPFANGGMYNEPYCITKIVASDGSIVYSKKREPQRFISAENAYIMTSMLTGVIEGGTGRRMQEIGIPLAGKSGTVGLTGSKLNRDAWMVAYNSEYVACSWMGFDNPDTEHALPSDVTGGTFPALFLAKVFSHIYEDRPAPGFIRPYGVVEARIDAKTLHDTHEVVLANALTPRESVLTEIFTQDTVPDKVSNYWTIPLPPDDLKAVKADNSGAVITFTPKNKFAKYKLYKQYTLTGTPKLIGEYSGSAEKVTVWDDTSDGNPCYYYVVPYHPELKMSGDFVEGPPSSRFRFDPGPLELSPTDRGGYTPSPSPSVTPSLSPSVSQSPGATPSPSPSASPETTPTPSPSPSKTP